MRPRREGRRQACLDVRLGPGAGDRRAARGAAPAEAGAGDRHRGPAALERAHGPAPPSRLPPPLRGTRPALRHRRRGAQAGTPAVRGGDEGAALPRPLGRVERQGEGPQAAPDGGERTASRVSMGALEIPGVLGAGHGGAAAVGRLGAPPRLAPRPVRDPSRTRPGSGPPAAARPTGSGSARPPRAGASRARGPA